MGLGKELRLRRHVPVQRRLRPLPVRPLTGWFNLSLVVAASRLLHRGRLRHTGGLCLLGVFHASQGTFRPDVAFPGSAMDGSLCSGRDWRWGVLCVCDCVAAAGGDGLCEWECDRRSVPPIMLSQS